MKRTPEDVSRAPLPGLDGSSRPADGALRRSEGRLQAVARAAALHAERQAIEDALSRFRWNRRKAARHLQVSYKTLLAKMRACGLIW